MKKLSTTLLLLLFTLVAGSSFSENDAKANDVKTMTITSEGKKIKITIEGQSFEEAFKKLYQVIKRDLESDCKNLKETDDLITETCNNLREAQDDLEDAQDDLEDVQHDLEDAQDDLEHAQDELEEAQDELEEAQDELHQEYLEYAQDDLEEAQDELEDVQENLEEAQNKLENAIIEEMKVIAIDFLKLYEP